MSKDIHIQAFQFLGGNKGDLEKTSGWPASCEWQDIAAELASTVPSVFPTCLSQREMEQAEDLSFINVPMNEPGMRTHTVYFAIQAVGGRSFFNVLCFAYREDAVSLHELAALSPSDWWSIYEQLTPSDTKLTLPEKNTELELPEWDGQKALFFRIPASGGRVLQGEFEDWREILKQASPPPYQPEPASEPKHPLLIKFAKVICAILVVMIICYTLTQWISETKPAPTAEQPAPTVEQPAPTSESKPEPAPTSEPDQFTELASTLEEISEPTDSRTNTAEHEKNINTKEENNNE